MNALWMLLFFISPLSCSSAHLVRRPIEEYTNTHIFQRFHLDDFGVTCTSQGNWTIMMNTSVSVKSRCGVGWGEEDGSLCRIKYMDSDDTAIYWCENEEGMIGDRFDITVSSGSVLLRTSVVPIIEGDDVFLLCQTLLDANIPRDVSVLFYKDDVLIGERTGRRMIIPNFSPVDAGFYKCEILGWTSPVIWISSKKPVDNGTNTVMSLESSTSLSNRNLSGSIQVTVNGVRVTASSGLKVSTGDYLTFSCEAANASEEWTVWRITSYNRNTMCGSNWGKQEGRICRISYMYPWHSGVYWCKSKGGTSPGHCVTITVSKAVRIPPLVTNITFDAGLIMLSHGTSQLPEREQLILACKAVNRSGEWTIWRKTPYGVGRCGVEWGMLFDSVCYKKYAYPRDSGVYWCTSTDGRISNPLILNVTDSKSVNLRIATLPIVEGDALALTCTSDSSDLLPNTPAVFYKDQAVIARLTRGYMVIKNFTASHESFYKCELPGYRDSPYSWLSVEHAGNICDLYQYDPPAWPTQRSAGNTDQRSVGVKTGLDFDIMVTVSVTLMINFLTVFM